MDFRDELCGYFRRRAGQFLCVDCGYFKQNRCEYDDIQCTGSNPACCDFKIKQ